MGRVVITASGKGGVGKSVFTVNLGATLADRGLKVVIIDMNIGLRNLDIYLGLENKVIFDIADVVSGLCKPAKALVRDKRFPHLFILPSTQSREKFHAAEEDMKKLYGELKESYDYILVDCPAGVNEDLRLAASGADTAILITTLEHVSLRDADMADRKIMETGLKKRAYIVNKVNKDLMRKGLLPTFEEVDQFLKPPLLGIIQYDDSIHLAANCGMPVVYQKGNYIEENFNKIADRLIAY